MNNNLLVLSVQKYNHYVTNPRLSRITYGHGICVISAKSFFLS